MYSAQHTSGEKPCGVADLGNCEQALLLKTTHHLNAAGVY
jgi:hypothetical protein